MRKDLLILLAVLIPATLIMLLLANYLSTKKLTNPFITYTPFPTISTSPKEDQETTSISPSSSRNIEILSPRVGDMIDSVYVVKGNARVFENVVSIRLMDSEGNILAQTTAMANSPDVGQFGPFEKELKFSTNTTTGTLEVYQVSAKDGTEIDKVVVPVQFGK